MINFAFGGPGPLLLAGAIHFMLVFIPALFIYLPFRLRHRIAKQPLKYLAVYSVLVIIGLALVVSGLWDNVFDVIAPLLMLIGPMLLLIDKSGRWTAFSSALSRFDRGLLWLSTAYVLAANILLAISWAV